MCREHLIEEELKYGGPNLNHRRFDGRFVVLNAYMVAYSVTMCNYICL